MARPVTDIHRQNIPWQAYAVLGNSLEGQGRERQHLGLLNRSGLLDPPVR
jgi:hypothetical protein